MAEAEREIMGVFRSLGGNGQLSFLVAPIFQLSCGLLLKFLNHVIDHALDLDEDVLDAVQLHDASAR